MAEIIEQVVQERRLDTLDEETRWCLDVRWSAARLAGPRSYPTRRSVGLGDILPVAAGIGASTLRRHTLRVAEHAEAELADERASFIEGRPADWQDLPIPEGRIVVGLGLDGGYLRDWTEKKTNFEVIVGRSMPEDRPARYFGLVHGDDTKPKRRLADVLASQGLQANQDVTVLTDGGEEIRALAERISPCSEHVLDWFHITMRLTVLGPICQGRGAK